MAVFKASLSAHKTIVQNGMTRRERRQGSLLVAGENAHQAKQLARTELCTQRPALEGWEDHFVFLEEVSQEDLTEFAAQARTEAEILAEKKR